MWARGKGGDCPSLSLWWEEKRVHSSWEPAGFLLWVFSSQQPKLVDFSGFFHVGSSPPRSWIQGSPPGSWNGICVLRNKKSTVDFSNVEFVLSISLTVRVCVTVLLVFCHFCHVFQLYWFNYVPTRSEFLLLHLWCFAIELGGLYIILPIVIHICKYLRQCKLSFLAIS